MLFTVKVHPHGMDFGALAFVRLYVWPVLVKVVRNKKGAARRWSFCGSTVDEHRPDRDLPLKSCAPGILCRKIQD